MDKPNQPTNSSESENVTIQCAICGETFIKNKNLAKSKSSESHPCPECVRLTYASKNTIELSRIRPFHRMTRKGVPKPKPKPKLLPKKKPKTQIAETNSKNSARLMCIECGATFNRYFKYVEHLAEEHRIVLNVETIKFDSLSDFDIWKCINAERQCERFFILDTRNPVFISYTCDFNQRINHKRTHIPKYLKSRSAIKKPTGVGSCPARMVIRKFNQNSSSSSSLLSSTVCDDQPVLCCYYSTHMGHETLTNNDNNNNNDNDLEPEQINCSIDADTSADEPTIQTIDDDSLSSLSNNNSNGNESILIEDTINLDQTSTNDSNREMITRLSENICDGLELSQRIDSPQTFQSRNEKVLKLLNEALRLTYSDDIL